MHNGTVTAAATAALAILSGFLVYFNSRLLDESSRSTVAALRAAESAERAAAAAMKEATATERVAAAAQLAVELDYRPVVVVTGTFGGNGIPYDTARIANLGRGPALNVRYLCRMSAQWHQFNPGHLEEWRMSNSFDLAGAQAPIEVTTEWVAGGQGPDAIWQGTNEIVEKVVFCQDQAGNRYRFVPFKPLPEVWHVTDEMPEWVEWYETKSG
jgi:hypothetical protein